MRVPSVVGEPLRVAPAGAARAARLVDAPHFVHHVADLQPLHDVQPGGDLP
jgi:hypothetical protein